MKKIIVTYFEPFGGRTANASKEVVSLLNDYNKKELPVSWSKISSCVEDLLADEPDYLFLVGEAGKRDCISVEKYARNIANGVDNDGVSKDNEKIDLNGLDVIETKFDLKKLPYRISEDAGKYLCNYTYYLALSKAKSTKVLFIHLPYIEKEGPNSLLNLNKDLTNIIETLIRED